MSKWAYTFSGEVLVEADSQEEAFAKVREILRFTAWQHDNSEDISLGEIELMDTDDENYEWEV